MRKRVILYASKFMNIYKDIQKALSVMNFEVIWIEANTIPNNPYNKTLGLYSQQNIIAYMKKATEKWDSLLKEQPFTEPVDFFISIVGYDIPPKAFEELERRNPKIKKILYLHDRVDGVYQIDEFFKYYNKIFSFDISDCNKFNLTLLPIYWVPTCLSNPKTKYDLFAFASYSPSKPGRTKIFKELKKFAQTNNLKEFIKLFDNAYNQGKVKYLLKTAIKKVLGKGNLNPNDILSGLITGNAISPHEYRLLIDSSSVVFDTQAEYQDGLTARFMWSLGLGKKIITTNPHIRNYDFYNPDQVCVINENLTNSKAELDKFLKTSYVPDGRQIKLIEPYRIDNWTKTLLFS